MATANHAQGQHVNGNRNRCLMAEKAGEYVETGEPLVEIRLTK